MAKYRVGMVFGAERVIAYQDGDKSVVNVSEFDTEAELNAYLQGVDEAIGWMDYEQVDDLSGIEFDTEPSN